MTEITITTSGLVVLVLSCVAAGAVCWWWGYLEGRRGR
jgi:hypothetical protein